MQNVLRIIAIVIEVIFLLWFLLPIRFHIFKAGNLLGVVICLIALFRTAFSSVYHQMDAFMLQNTITKIIWLIIKYGCIMFAIYAVIVSICMIAAMKIKPKKNATAVILGAQVKPWGASRLLLQRIKAAESYLDQNPVAKAIASGGQGDNEPMSEAQCMYNELIKKGISPERMFREDQSVNTAENIRFSGEVIRKEGLSNDLAIVTDGFHELRAALISQEQGFSCGAVPSETPLYLAANFTIREMIALTARFVGLG